MRVRYHFPRKHLFCWPIFFGLLSLTAVAHAQVYKSYDAKGNVVFSDKPTKRSQEVDINKPNLSDSFKIPPQSFEVKPEPKPEPEPVAQPIPDYDPADTNKDGRISKREKEKERKERRRKKREQAKAAEADED